MLSLAAINDSSPCQPLGAAQSPPWSCLAAHRHHPGPPQPLGAAWSPPWSCLAVYRYPPGPGCNYPVPGQHALKAVAAVAVAAVTAVTTAVAAAAATVAAVTVAVAAAVTMTAAATATVTAAAVAAAAAAAVIAAVESSPRPRNTQHTEPTPQKPSFPSAAPFLEGYQHGNGRGKHGGR